MIELDASIGEGGGQILRSALALSLLTGLAAHLVNVRARRSKPGLGPQHLRAVEAAAALGRAQVSGAHLGSTEIAFRPAGLIAGEYGFDIGTAGATSLLLQTLFVPLAFAGASSQLTLGGGTHVPASPSYHYLEWQWLPWLRAAGFSADLQLLRPGFYPRGGGAMRAWVEPAGRIRPLRLVEPGRLLRVRGLAAVAGLPAGIAERERGRMEERLAALEVPTAIRSREIESMNRGNFVVLAAELEGGRLCYGGLGAIGKPAEAVADEAVDALLGALAGGGAIDEHLADQLLLPLAFAEAPSELAIGRVTGHLLTNAEVLRRFLPEVPIEIEGAVGKAGKVRIAGGARAAVATSRCPRMS